VSDRAAIAAMVGDILDCCEGHTPVLFYMGLVLAAGTFLKAQYPHDLEEAYKGHCENLKSVMEELDKRS